MILCPGWEKVQTVLELLEDSKATYNLHPTSVLLGVDQEEPKKFKIQRNCKFLSAIEEMSLWRVSFESGPKPKLALMLLCLSL